MEKADDHRTSALPQPGSGARLVPPNELIERINRNPEAWGRVMEVAGFEYGCPTAMEVYIKDGLVKEYVRDAMVRMQMRAIKKAARQKEMKR